MSGPCPNCHTVIQGPNHYHPPQPQPLNPPVAEGEDFTLPVENYQTPKAEESVPVLTAPALQVTPEPVPEPLPVPVPEPQPASEVTPEPAPEPSPQYHSEPERPPQPQEEPTPDPRRAERPPQSPPEPLLEVDPEPATPRKRQPAKASLSLLQAFLLSFFCSIIFFALGFFLGKTGAVDWSEIVAAAEKQKEAEANGETPEPSAESGTTPDGVPPLNPGGEQTEPAPTSDNATARASLEAFLAADSWSVRNAFVLFPNEMLSEMEASAEVHGDGPYLAESIRLEIDQPNMKVFEVKAPQHPGSFKVMLLKDNEHWRVDWPGFADFYHARLRAFANGMEGSMRGTFRVLLKPAPGETSPLSPAHCLISTELYPETYQVISATDSPARKKLAETFQTYLQSAREDFEEAMADQGIPLIVELSRNGASNPTLRLERVISAGWGPHPPEKTPRGDSSRFY